MRELVGRFGGDVGDGAVGVLLDRVAELCSVWDYRAGVRERFDTARVDFEPEVDGRIRELIGALGLGGAERPAHREYQHVVILGGGIRVALGRIDYASRLLGAGLVARTVAGLGSLRWRDDREQREGVRLGLEAFDTEADILAVGLRRYLGLGESGGYSAGDGWWHRVWDGEPQVHVLAAASTRPPLRANTGDTLLGWAAHVAEPAPDERVLLVTNDPYTRHQHCDAVRLLGMRFRCGIETVGFDSDAMSAWGRPLATTERLQEVRSSILAMRNLYQAVTS